MRSAHDIHAWVLIISNGVVGVWALAAHRWPALRHTALWVAVVLAQITTGVQAILGVAVSRSEDIEINDMHMLYGFSAIVAVGIMYSYRNSPFMKGKELVLYGFGSLFVMGLGLRNLALGT